MDAVGPTKMMSFQEGESLKRKLLILTVTLAAAVHRVAVISFVNEFSESSLCDRLVTHKCDPN